MGYRRRKCLDKLKLVLKYICAMPRMLGPQCDVYHLSVVLTTSSPSQVVGPSPYVFIPFSITCPVVQLFPAPGDLRDHSLERDVKTRASCANQEEIKAGTSHPFCLNLGHSCLSPQLMRLALRNLST